MLYKKEGKIYVESTTREPLVDIRAAAEIVAVSTRQDVSVTGLEITTAASAALREMSGVNGKIETFNCTVVSVPEPTVVVTPR